MEGMLRDHFVREFVVVIHFPILVSRDLPIHGERSNDGLAHYREQVELFGPIYSKKLCHLDHLQQFSPRALGQYNHLSRAARGEHDLGVPRPDLRSRLQGK